MNTQEELLQRFFDNDLNDKELASFFTEAGANTALRNQYRTFLQMRSELSDSSAVPVPESLDRRISLLRKHQPHALYQDRPSIARISSKRMTLSVPALTAVMLLMLIGGLVAARMLFTQTPVTEYVYVVEMQPIVIESSFIQ